MAPITQVVQAPEPHNSIYLQARLWHAAVARWGGEGAVLGVRALGRAGDRGVVLYHYGSFDWGVFRVPWRGPLLGVFHNVTPARLLYRWNPLVAARAALAAAQLRALPQGLRWIAVSPFNRQVLYAYGFRQVDVVPLVIEPAPGGEKSETPLLLFVGRITPSKNVAELLRGHEQVCARSRQRPRLVIVGARKPRCRYGDWFERCLERSRWRHLVTWEQHPLAYRRLLELHTRAWLYVSLSLHEGFGVPVCQSVAAGTPALYLACGGTESVLNGVGCMWRGQAEFAELVVEHLENPQLREELLSRQAPLVAQYRSEIVGQRLLEVARRAMEAGDC